MDSHQSFPFPWSSHGPAYDQQLHGLLGRPQQPAPSSSTFEATFPNSFEADMANEIQPNNDISMTGNEEQDQPAPPVAIAQPKVGPFRRVEGEHLDWDAYKDAIWNLYIGQNKSLSETMQDMERLHAFKAS